MTPKKLESLSYRELLKLQSRIQTLIEARRESQRTVLRNQIESMAQSAGFNVDELFSTRRSAASRSAQEIRYRHPDDASLTWTGRGRRPKWLNRAGGNIERFRVA